MPAKTDKRKYNFLECLPEGLAAYKTGIETLVQDELAVFSKRLEQSLLREITAPHSRQSVTTSMNRSGNIPELLSLDGLRQEGKGSKNSDLSKQLISVQVREYHVVDKEATPAVLYTITSAFAGGYHATVYRMQQDIDMLYKLFGRRACVAPFTAPSVGDSKALPKSCATLRTFLLRILRCPPALGNKQLFAWFGLDRAFSSSREDEILSSAFEDVWRLYYSDKERIFSDTPEDMLTLYLTSRIKSEYAATFDSIKNDGGVAGELQAVKCVMFYVRRGVCEMWEQWRASAPVLVRKFALLPEGEFDDAIEDALSSAKKQIADALAPFNKDATAAFKSMFTVLTPLVKAVRHTMREYRPRKQATMTGLLSAQPNEIRDYKFDDLDAKLLRVKSKVKGSVEHAVRTFEKELELNVKAEGGDKSATARLIPFMRKIPTLARACFYLSQPTVMATFMKNFILERERLCASAPNAKAKDRSAIDVFADRMSHVLTFLERDLSFSDFCVKSDFADEILDTHNRDESLPTNSRFAYVLRTFYGMLSRLVSLRMQFFVNMTKMFVSTLNDMGLDAVVSLQLRIAMVRSASLTAYNEASTVYERHLLRQIPDMVTDLATAMMLTPAKEVVTESNVLPALSLAVSRNKDPVFNTFLDVNNLVELALCAELRSAVEATVAEWWKVGMNKREYDPLRTAAAVNKRKEKKAAEESKKKDEEAKQKAAAAEEKPKKKKKKSKAAPAAEPAAEPAAADAEPAPAEKPKKKKKKVAVAA